MAASKLIDVCEYLDRFAPLHLAAEWDNVGLLVGETESVVRRIMTCLTLTPPVALEAIERGVDLIVTHHPVMFRGIKKLTSTSPDGALLLPLIRAQIAVYSPHTAFDNTVGGINERLAQKLGLKQLRALRSQETGKSFKVVVFVPDSHLAAVADAMFAAGAGRIGEYRECSFRLAGTGTFFSTETTNPTLGQKGRREEVSEWRLEMVCPASALEAVLSAMRRAHNYEEPAYDVYPLQPSASAIVGQGRVGQLEAPTTLGELAQRVKTALHLSQIAAVGEPSKPVERVAIACGAAGEFLTDAIRARADVFLTGELRFHDALLAEAKDIGVLIPGHYATERFAVEALVAVLTEKFPQLEIFTSQQEKDPMRYW